MAKITSLEGAILSSAVYGNDNTEFIEPKGYVLAKDINGNYITHSDSTTDLQMALYTNGTTNVVAFRGTSSIADVITDGGMGVATLMEGLVDAFTPAGETLANWIRDFSLSSSNTTIVGHSLGGALAQYFGATTGYETLTYNAYGVGAELNGGSYDNITNYVTISDPVSALPMSSMVGKTYMLQDGDLLDAFGHGITNFTSEESWVRGYTPIDDIHSIHAVDGYAFNASDIAAELVAIAIEGRRYATINGSTDDLILGGEKYNLLIGGSGKDTLYGMGGSDNLQGGKGFDTYISDNGDKIYDEDGKGEVYFEGVKLTGGIAEELDCNNLSPHRYIGDGGVYTLSGKTLSFTKDGKKLTINNYIKTKDGDLNIILEDPKDDNKCPHPVQPCFPYIFLPVPVSPIIINTPPPSPFFHLSEDGYSYSTSGGGGSSSGGYYECIGDPAVTHSAGAGGGGGSTGPIVLDLNHDGITSVSIAASIALFDYDGDGIKENTAWIQSADALLVNDVNNDGLINDASELFGNYTRNSDGSIARGGYQALSYYDSNKDNTIDANDERFGELKVWVDSDGDGATDNGELKTLSELGITSLSINTSTPYIATTEKTNTIIQETTFTDAQGEGIMRDVLFKYESNYEYINNIYFDMDANGFKEKMTTWTDSNQWMVVRDNNNDGKINDGSEIVGNHMILNTGTVAPDTIQALKTFDINHDGVIDASDDSGLAFWTDRNHNGLTDAGELEALGAAGAIQVIKLNSYQLLLSTYETGDDIIDSNDNVSNYLYVQTNPDGTITIYLPDNPSARAMIAGYAGGESIQTADGEKIIKEVLFYDGYEMNNNDTLEGTNASETLQGGRGSDTISGAEGRDIIDAGAGNDTISGGVGSDKLLGGAGDDTYLYSTGDGKDLIIDTAGSDTITFADGITANDLIIKTNGADISIYIKDGNKSLSELTNQIIIKDWHTTGSIETLAFGDGTSINAHDVVAMFATNKDDTIYGTDNSETIYGANGNDVLQGRGGSDTYIFNLENGNDVIIDNEGIDILRFGEGITRDDLIIKKIGNDITIGIKEDGVAFENLVDTITIKDWYDATSKIKRFIFADGVIANDNWVLEELNVEGRTIDGTNESEVLNASNGSDTVNAYNGDDVINGKDGNDTINAGDGNDTIIGGTGNDTLKGDDGNDTYIFNRGDGKDTITDYEGRDTLKFGEGITKDDIIVYFVEEAASHGVNELNLIIAIKEDGKTIDEFSDKITLKYWGNDQDQYKIENISFIDGTSIYVSEIIDMQLITESNDVIVGSDGNDTINALGGNDVLKANDGDDIITGGTGNDTLKGGRGNDTYIFNRGDGQDNIIDYGGTDTLKFGREITKNDLVVQVSGENLIIAIKEDGVAFENLSDKITIDKYYHRSIDKILFIDNTSLDIDDIIYMQATESNDIIIGTNNNNIINALGGNDEIDARDGNDTIIGGTGNDTIEGGYGNDTYIFNRGDGQDAITDYRGTDTIRFGEGITKDDIIIKVVKSLDAYGYIRENLVIAIKEDGVAFENLSDTITIKNYYANNNQIDNITFADGTSLTDQDLIAMQSTNQDDIIIGTSSNDTINALGGNDRVGAGDGNDIITGGTGNDILHGGYGNDTYIFNRGDGQDIIVLDYEGTDIIKFGEGITKDDIIIKVVKVFESSNGYGYTRENLVIAIKEDGVAFENLSDKVTIQNWSSYYYQKIESISFMDGTMLTYQEIITMQSSNQDDIIIGTSSDDTINALGGNDVLKANDGDDIITGGTGNDTIDGGNGNDTYIFNRGDGKDTITDYRETNIIKFGEGITKDDIIIKGVESLDDVYGHTIQNLVIAIKEDGVAFENLSDKITIKNYGYGSIENIIFNNGASLVGLDIVSMQSTNQDDIIIGTPSNNRINALGGNDKVGAGDGDDIITGGTGNDTIDGGGGNDTYIFNIGDGQDIITDYGGTDTIRFGEGITKDDLIVQANGNNLIIAIKEDGVAFENLSDKITISNYYSYYNYNKIENVTLADGTSLTEQDLVAIHSTNQDDIIIGTSSDDTINALGGNDRVDADDGDDTITGGTGNDTIDGGDGNDTYIFNRGDGQDTITDYNGTDIIKFGEGITKDDIIIKGVESLDVYGYVRENLVIAIKEDGVTFENLSDKITIENYNYSPIENIIFNDRISLTGQALIAMQSTNQDDIIIGTSSNDTINALGGNDTINAGDGNDTITGGTGNDILHGGYGNDTYIFNRGDGQDTIIDNIQASTIRFVAGITRNDIIIRLINETGSDGKESLNLIIAIKEDGVAFENLSDKITIKNYNYSYDSIENIVFTDGTILGYQEIITMQSSESDDIIMGSSNNDTLIGGLGNDTLQGKYGNDTYIFNRGDGEDTISDSSGTNTLKFGEGVSKDNLITRFENNNLIIAIKEDGVAFENLSDKITISNYSYYYNTIENVTLADGTSLTEQDLVAMQSTNQDDIIIGSSSNDIINALGGNDTINAGNGDDTINGGAGNDIIDGGYGNNTLIGEEGNDTIYGGNENDTLVGGLGNDTLQGKYGNDTYIFNRGDGKDTINDDYGTDTLRFGEGITKDDLATRFENNNLIIAIKEDGVAFENLSDKITISNYSHYNNKIENVTLADGTSLTDQDLIAMQSTNQDDIIIGSSSNDTINALGGNDTINAGNGDDTINGGAGNDTIDGGYGNNTLIGEEGNDTLNGGYGNDTLIGGSENDTLRGGYGNDTYRFNIGDGVDTIYDNYGTDTLRFGEGITKDDLATRFENNNLIIAIKEDGVAFENLSDKITISNHYSYYNDNKIENVTLADGTPLTNQDLIAMQSTNQDDIIMGTSSNDTINALGGNDTINAGNGDDTINGGAGNDTLNGGYDNDTYIFNIGDGVDTIYDNYGTDTLRVGEGITKDDLATRFENNNLIIAIKEDGVAFENLSDKITISNYSYNKIENVTLADGTSLTEQDIINVQVLSEQDDSIIGTSSNDTINTLGGNDEIDARDGNDTITGGTGNDTIDGGDGNDTYIFNRGDGKDTIIEDGGIDIIKFGEGITKDDIIIKGVESFNVYGYAMQNLVIAIKEDGVTFENLSDKITIKNYNYSTIENIVFIDGISLTEQDLIAMQSTNQDDIIIGSSSNDTINTLGGNDTIDARDGNDTIIGGTGNDTIYGGDGNDIITGGTGNDILKGGYGNDTYIFNRGDGKDTIINDYGGADTLKFGDGITRDDLILQLSGSSLVIALKEKVLHLKILATKLQSKTTLIIK